MRTTRWAVAVAVGNPGLAGCGSDEVSTGSEAGSTSADRSSEASGALLTTADSSLGEIVVDGGGRTVHVFDEDVAGSGGSACSGTASRRGRRSQPTRTPLRPTVLPARSA